jgi:hypothetical protein
MSDPTRWRDDPTGLPAGAGVLLRGTRRPQPPAAYELERLGAVVDGISRRPIPASGLRLAVAAVVAFAIAGGGTFVWAVHVRNEKRAAAAAAAFGEDARVRETARVRRPAMATLTPDTLAPVAPTPAAPVRVRRHAAAEPRVPNAAPAEAMPSNDMLAREVPLIDAGRSELATSPSRALAALEAHRREFPHGQLAAEREFLAVQALVQMNRIADAKKRADDLAARFPTSSYAARAARLVHVPTDVDGDEAQRPGKPTLDGSRGTNHPGTRRASDRL